MRDEDKEGMAGCAIILCWCVLFFVICYAASTYIPAPPPRENIQIIEGVITKVEFTDHTAIVHFDDSRVVKVSQPRGTANVYKLNEYNRITIKNYHVDTVEQVDP